MIKSLENDFMTRNPEAFLVSHRIQDLIEHYGHLDVYEAARIVGLPWSSEEDILWYKSSIHLQLQTHLSNIRNTYTCYYDILGIFFPELKSIKKSS